MFTSLFQLEQKPVTVFSSADAGAPILTKDPGSLKTLLKACLVTGYGSKASLGWQMPFESEDTKSAAFVSNDPTASKYVFKIDNSGIATAKLSAYQSMTSIDTGVKPIVIDNIYDLHAGTWMLVGHGKAFILLLNATSYYYANPCAYPIIFGDLPRESKRVEPLVLLWTGRTCKYSISGLQSTLFNHVQGKSDTQFAPGINYANCYPFVVNHGSGGQALTSNFCRFSHKSIASASVLYEPVFSALNDSSWTLIPMLQPLSNTINDVANLGSIDTTAVKAVTGGYGVTTDNNDCAVPIDWWYA